MAGTFTNLNYHLVFSTKHRRPMISEEIRPRLYAYLGGIIKDDDGVLYQIGGMPDHVHLLIRYKPARDISHLMQDLKSHSSGWVHKTFSGHDQFQWQEGYGAFTVSKSQCARVQKYIANQEGHHQNRDFKSEFIALLNAHGCEYDEKYIWD
ncbi:IS200/IS605 family transposase [Candidatus Sumerlaeota bacterium]|nr:IS200/IS605 family transposase [Candidatus Sumerlaeota bacterium]